MVPNKDNSLRGRAKTKEAYMTNKQWQIFSAFKTEFKNKISEWHSILEKENLFEELKVLQRQTAEKDGVPFYELSDPFVYNKSLDDVRAEDDIKLIVIGDNPGKKEQLAENRRYLVGQSGIIAENFFKRNQELGIDFRKNVIILNKTPLHTAKTKELSILAKANPKLKELILESQLWCAESTAKLHCDLSENAENGKKVSLWLVGYAELKGKGIFIPYRDFLLQTYNEHSAWKKVFVYQHFSMNRFLIDLRKNTDESVNLQENLNNLGKKHRDEIFSK